MYSKQILTKTSLVLAFCAAVLIPRDAPAAVVWDTDIGTRTSPQAGDGIVETDPDITIVEGTEIYVTGIGVSTTAGLITNDGTVYSQYNSAIIIESGAAANFTNSDTGTIEVEDSTTYGIAIGLESSGSSDPSFTNAGSITITSAEGGIALGDGNKVFDNSGTLLVIKSETIGAITFGTGSDTLTNTGDIEIRDSDADGIDMGAGANTLTNTETGNIAIGTTSDHGIAFGSGVDAISNSGSMTIEDAGRSLETSTNAMGIAFGTGADTLTNNSGATLEVLSAGHTGIHFGDDAAGDTLNNDGSLTIGNTGSSGIAFGDGADTLDNQGRLTITEAGLDETVDPAAAIDLGDGSDELVNGASNNTDATLSIGAASGAGIDFGTDSSADALTNYGSIDIGTTGGNSIAFGDGADTLDNFGDLTVDATIDMGAGDDVVTTSGAMNFGGAATAIDAGDGTDTLSLKGTGSQTMAGDIVNFEVLNKEQSGSWTLEGDTTIGDSVTIVGGELIIGNGTLSTGTGPMSVSGSGAAFRGNADIAGSLTTGGTLAPGGDAVGTIVVGGSYSEAGNATYEVTLGSSQTSDLILVSNNATLQDTTLVTVTPVGYIGDGDTFTILDAGDGALSGTYNSANLTSNSIVLAYDFVFDGPTGQVRLTADRTTYEELGISEKSQYVGEALIDLVSQGNIGAAAALGRIDSLGTAAEVDDALAGFAPEQYPNLLDVSMAGFNLYRSAVIGRMGNLHMADTRQDLKYGERTNRITAAGPATARIPAFENRRKGGWSSWGRVIYMSGEQDPSESFSGYDFDTYGLSVGVDNKIDEGLALGAGIGFASSDVDFGNDLQQSDIESFHGSLYSTYSNERFYLDGALLFATNDYESDRSIPLVGLKAHSDTDGTEWGAHLGGGYDMLPRRGHYFIPTLSVTWSRIDIDGFEEDGAGDFNLSVDDYDADSFVSSLGFRWGGQFVDQGVLVEPELRAAWVHEYADTERKAQARFVGSTVNFPIHGIEPDEDSAVVGAGVNMFLTRNFTFFIDYDGEFGSDFAAHLFSLGMRYDF